MNLFEAIFVRKSVRSYTNEGISPKVLEDILKQFDEINGLFGGDRKSTRLNSSHPK